MTIYYIEINTICIILLLFLLSCLRQQQGEGSTGRNIFRLLILTTILLCAADLFSGVLSGQIFHGARTLIWTGNLFFFAATTTVCYLWLLYVNIKLNNAGKKKTALWSIPLLLIIAVVVSDPWTDILFTLDSNNFYLRGTGVYLHWIINWTYLLVPTVQIAWAVFREKSKVRRQELRILLYFIIAPAAAGIIQMLCYGVSCLQVGITISLLIVFIYMQNIQILTDALTGLNNRRSFENYSDQFVRHHEDEEFFIMMLDINNFKQINDKLSHIVGDRALRDTADVMKRVCEREPHRLFLCRYGEDEFVIAGCDCGDGYEVGLRKRLENGFKEHSTHHDSPYVLTVSIGVATGKCSDPDDVMRLLNIADEEMYEEKKGLNQLRR